MTQEYRPVGVFTTDRNLVIRTWDVWLERVTGISSEQARGKILSDVFPEIASRRLIEPFNRVLQSGVVEVLSPALHHFLIDCAPSSPSKRFTKMQQRVAIAPLREETAIVGAIVTIEDVTARIEQESDLVRVLADEDWRKRKMAVEELAQQSTDDVVKRLLVALREDHQNLAVLNSALQVLAISGWDIVTPLTDFLKGDDVDLRIYAALALGEQARPEGIIPLIAALDDPDENVRYHAIEGLGKLRASEATEPLMEILRERDFFLSFAAIDALAVIADPRCVPLLLELMNDELLRAPAAETLGVLGEIGVVERVSNLLNGGKLPALTAAGSLVSLYDRYEKDYAEGGLIADLAAKYIDAAGARFLAAALETAASESLRSLALVIGWLEGDEIERVLTNLLSERRVRKEVFAALLRHGRKISDLVMEQLGAVDLETQRVAVTLLGELGETKAVPSLVKMLSKDGELTAVAADALAKIGDRSAFESLLGLLGHEKVAVRQAAVGAINSLGHPDMASRALELLHSQNAHVRESAVRIAGYFAYPECTQALMERCSDADESVQRAAIEHLPYLEDCHSIAILLDRIERGSPKIRAAAAQALGHMKDPRIGDALHRALKDADPWVRYYATRSLAKLGAAGAIESLGELAQNDGSAFVRIAAIEALGLVGAEAVTRLQPLAVSDDRNIAGAALEALGKTRAADAFSALMSAAHAADSDRRIDAATALFRYGGSDSVKVLQWLGADDDSRVADVAVQRLAAMAAPESIAALIGLTGEKKRGKAAAAALSGLAERHWGLIATGLKHPQPGVRCAIVEVFGRLKHPSASKWIARALDDDIPFVRLAAVNALARTGNAEHKKKLIRVAQSDPDSKVRLAARKAVEPAT